VKVSPNPEEFRELPACRTCRRSWLRPVNQTGSHDHCPEQILFSGAAVKREGPILYILVVVGSSADIGREAYVRLLRGGRFSRRLSGNIARTQWPDRVAQILIR